MARSISNVKVFVSLVAKNISVAFQRSCYAVVASPGLAGVGNESVKISNVSNKDLTKSTVNDTWVLHATKGYYRPANQVEDVDDAMLRKILLKQKIHSSQ